VHETAAHNLAEFFHGSSFVLIRRVLISERGIYAASLFKAVWALKRAEARAPRQIQPTPLIPILLAIVIANETD
jgi:hypothetical protein